MTYSNGVPLLGFKCLFDATARCFQLSHEVNGEVTGRGYIEIAELAP